MAGKITELTELTSGNLHNDDLIEVLDVSDTSMAASGTNKKTLWSSIKVFLKAYFDTTYATFAQGATADTAVQPGDLGTAAGNNTSDFATAAQGATADSAVQPGDLGGAALLNVGTTAGTVAAGDDSRMTNARTPTAHASTHTNGTDDIQNATSAQKGLATAAQITKLDGIEALADVTDAANVAAAGAVMSGGALGTPSSGNASNLTNFPTLNQSTSGNAATATALQTSRNINGVAFDGTSNITIPRTGVVREVWIGAGAMTPRTTNGAAPATVEMATNDNTFDFLDFDTATEEGACFTISLPQAWDAGTVKVKVYWTAASGSGGVAWGLRATSYANDDALDSAYGTEQVVTDTLITANDNHISSATSAITIGNTPTVDDLLLFEITREVANGSDTLAVDARLIGVKLQFTETSTEPSAW
jgi:hypothetical protein